MDGAECRRSGVPTRRVRSRWIMSTQCWQTARQRRARLSEPAPLPGHERGIDPEHPRPARGARARAPGQAVPAERIRLCHRDPRPRSNLAGRDGHHARLAFPACRRRREVDAQRHARRLQPARAHARRVPPRRQPEADRGRPVGVACVSRRHRQRAGRFSAHGRSRHWAALRVPSVRRSVAGRQARRRHRREHGCRRPGAAAGDVERATGCARLGQHRRTGDN